MGGQSYQMYSTTNVAAGTVVAVQLAGLPWAGGSGLSPTQLAVVALGVVLFVLGAGMFLFVGRRGATPLAASEAVEPADPTDTEQERLQLVLRLAALDDRFASGEVSEDEYRAERDRGKQRLVALTRALKTQPAAH
jgi:hypothetical protein